MSVLDRDADENVMLLFLKKTLSCRFHTDNCTCRWNFDTLEPLSDAHILLANHFSLAIENGQFSFSHEESLFIGGDEVLAHFRIARVEDSCPKRLYSCQELIRKPNIGFAVDADKWHRIP